MLNVMKGGGHPTPTLTSLGLFTLMMECTIESSGCYSVYSVDWSGGGGKVGWDVGRGKVEGGIG